MLIILLKQAGAGFICSQLLDWRKNFAHKCNKNENRDKREKSKVYTKIKRQRKTERMKESKLKKKENDMEKKHCGWEQRNNKVEEVKVLKLWIKTNLELIVEGWYNL